MGAALLVAWAAFVLWGLGHSFLSARRGKAEDQGYLVGVVVGCVLGVGLMMSFHRDAGFFGIHTIGFGFMLAFIAGLLIWARGSAARSASRNEPLVPVADLEHFRWRRERYLRGGHQPCHDLATRCRFLVALRRRQVEPHVSENIILGHTLSLAVQETETELRTRDSLFGSAPKPLERFAIILGYTSPLGVHETEIVLRVGVSLLRSQSIPIHGFAIILSHTLPHRIHDAEIELRVCDSFFSSEPIPFQGFAVVLGGTCFIPPYTAL
jgi:hypothetical protein